jgi:hypothetical protein
LIALPLKVVSTKALGAVVVVVVVVVVALDAAAVVMLEVMMVIVVVDVGVDVGVVADVGMATKRNGCPSPNLVAS